MDNATELWSEALDRLGMSAPDGSKHDPWQPLFQSFGQRGFVRLTHRPDSGAFRIQLATPTLSVDETRDALRQFLARFEINAERPTGDDRSADDEDAALVQAQPVRDADEEAIADRFVDILRQLRTIGDAISDDDLDNLPEWLADRRESSTSGAEAADGQAHDGAAGASDVFEPIGEERGSHDGGTPDGRADSVGDEVDFNIADYRFTDDRGPGSVAEIEFDYAVPSSAIDLFAEGLAHSLRARFDVQATLESDDIGPGPRHTVRVRVQPTSTASDNLDAAEQTATYLDRVIRFQTLGVPAAETLGLSSEVDARSTPESTAGRSTRRRGHDAETDDSSPEPSGHPRNTPPADRAKGDTTTSSASSADVSQETDGVTLGAADANDQSAQPDDTSGETTLASSEEASGPLEAGHFSDPRLQREDASTSLVDVILRHPGYRDERMAQVLSILLSLDYPDAKQLVAQAPTHLAWGVGRDRASRIKRVIEDSGGKVVFVEPDSIPS